MKKIDILIIGAGLSGLSAAYVFEKRRARYLLAEKRQKAGGLASSICKNGFVFDYSGHLLHFHKPQTKKLVLSLLRGNYSLIKRRAAVSSSGILVPFPFQANLYKLPHNERKECVLEFLKAQKRQINRPDFRPKYFRDWSLWFYGRGISKYFMLPYNFKLWQYPLEKLNIEWCSAFVPQLRVEDVIRGAYFQGKRSLGYNASFYYPKRGGIQALSEAFLERIKPPSFNLEIIAVDVRNKTAFLKEGHRIKYKYLINTAPLNRFVAMIKNAPPNIYGSARKLRANIVYVLNIGIKKVSAPLHWIYFPEKKFAFYRAGISSNFSKYTTPKGNSAMYIEVASNKPVDIEKTEKEIMRSLKSLSFIRSKEDVVEKLWLKINPAYVIYNDDREKSLKEILSYLLRNNIYSIGRYGAWKYSFMEEDISTGIKTAEQIITEI